jgi:1-acyl-sn-glycerol-3-phosphate acyltransferase
MASSPPPEDNAEMNAPVAIVSEGKVAGRAPDLLGLMAEVRTRAMAAKAAQPVPSVREVLFRRLPFMQPFDRIVFRIIMLVARRQVVSISGLEHIQAAHPFILALNHSTRREAVVVPAALIFHRGGNLIHFWSDWVFRLIPGIGMVLRRSGTICVPTKRSRHRLLNLFKPLFAQSDPAFRQARALLKARRPIGVFPEGTVNRDRGRLLPGRFGAARLSLENGAPVIPAGIRFPEVGEGQARVPERTAIEIRIGAPLTPPRCRNRKPTFAEVRDWHATVMREIARLSGKTWEWQAVGRRLAPALDPAAPPSPELAADAA